MGDGGRRPVAGLGEGVLERADDQAADQADVAEPHLGLHRVDVDVERLGRDFQKQRHQGMAIGREQPLIASPYGAVEQAVAHRPAVDEQILQGRVAAVEGRQPGVTREPRPLALGEDRHGVVGEIPAHDRAEPLETRLRGVARYRRQLDRRPRPVAQIEPDTGMGHADPVDRFDRVGHFGRRRLEELEPRRSGVEQVADLDPGAGGVGGRLHPALAAALDGDAPGAVGAVRAAGEGQPGDGADRRQRLAAKPEGGDVLEVVVGKLRGGVALDRQLELGGGHPGAVVGNRDQRPAAVADDHVDPRRPGVDAVLHQLLDRRRRPLDHLAGGDAVDDGLGEPAQGHRRQLFMPLYALIRPLVEESWPVTGPSLVSSGRIALASCLPSSTPHWSKELIRQITPWTKILCS